jgi:hypothetical protein
VRLDDAVGWAMVAFLTVGTILFAVMTVGLVLTAFGVLPA